MDMQSNLWPQQITVGETTSPTILAPSGVPVISIGDNDLPDPTAIVIKNGFTKIVLRADGSMWLVNTDSGAIFLFGANGVLTTPNVVNVGTYLASAGVRDQNGTPVLGIQQAAIDDATGAGDVVAQLNAALTALRAHGLIAT